MYDSDITWSDVKERAEHVYFVDVKHDFRKFRTEMLVFISELYRACQGGVEDFFQATCRDELDTLRATRLTVVQVVLELIEKPQQTRR
jgi:hypothetical protein